MSQLTSGDLRVLREAYDDTCRAWAIYCRANADFGSVQPFRTMHEADERQVLALEALFMRHDIRLPNTRSREAVPHFHTIEQALAAAHFAELERIRNYGRLHAAAQDPEIRAAMLDLERASRDERLPAIELSQRAMASPEGHGSRPAPPAKGDNSRSVSV